MKQKRRQSTLLVSIYSVFISYDIDIKSNYTAIEQFEIRKEKENIFINMINFNEIA